MHCSCTMKSSTTVVEVLRAPAVRAPSLAHAVNALLTLALHPEDRRAKITVSLLAKTGALDCPACGVRFAASGYRETRTVYGTTCAMSCQCCGTHFVVDETHVA